MRSKCTQIAIGGVFSAFCMIVMCMTMLIPFGTYALPAMAGAMLVAVVEENGRSTAVMVYASVSLLSVFMVPDVEAAMMFVVFFGYYPILQGVLEKAVRHTLPRYLLKFLLFNTAVVGGYLFTANVLGVAELLEGMDEFGRYTVHLLLVSGNVLFLLYDFLLRKYSLLYRFWFKPKILRR